MEELIQSFLGGAGGAALIGGIFALYERKRSRNDVHGKALRYLMLYNIQERAMRHIAENKITLSERHLLHAWHDLYHYDLHGNGDADDLMEKIDELPLDT